MSEGESLAGILRSLSSQYSALCALLFPPRCVVCRARGDWLCARCRPHLALFQPPLCPRCGMPVDEGAPCELCRGRRLPVTALRACGYFEGPLREAVHRLKFSGERYLAEPLADLLVTTWRWAPLPADALIPVPLHPAREAARGYNQSSLLARQVGKKLDLPVLEGHLRRLRATPPQVDLPREERLRNLVGAFVCVGREAYGRRLCLVDDVTTTGATLAACATALRAAGAGSVVALVLAKAR